MQRLTPLVIGLLVAMAAVLRIGKGVRLNEIVAYRGGISGHGDLAFDERKVVGLAHLVRVGFANFGFIRLCILRRHVCAR